MARCLSTARVEPTDTELHLVHYIIIKYIVLQHAIRIYISKVFAPLGCCVAEG